MSDSLALRFLYRTPPGRAVLRLLVHPALSKLAGKVLDSSLSRCLIPFFQSKNGITLEGIRIPEGGFPSFNAFFCRSRLCTDFDMEPQTLCSPCDGWLSAFFIDENSIFTVKHTQYSLAELLKSKDLATRFSGGTALIFRLTPADYHRYSYIDAGAVMTQRTIPGVLHCVRPIATERFLVYVQNSREYALIRSDHFGTMIQMEVGALLIGRISNHKPTGRIQRGQERGYFEFGGSTIILFLEKDTVNLNPIYLTGEEQLVTIGQTLGSSTLRRLPKDEDL